MRRQISLGRAATLLLAMVLLGAGAGCASSGGPPKLVSAGTVEGWPYNGMQGWKISTPHYAIYTMVQQEEVRSALPQVMEGALAEYQRLAPGLRISDRPMDCYVFQTRDQWEHFTREITGKDAAIYLQIRRGGFTLGDRYVSYFIGLNGTSSVAAHEGWHQFVARNFIGRLPPFLEEGLATTFEGVTWRGDQPRWNPSINPLRAQSLRHSIEDKHLWPLEKLITMHAGEVVNQSGERIEAFYSQCWAFAKFMREAEGGKYRPALERWLADTAAGTVFDPTHSHTRVGLPWIRAGVKPMIEHYTGVSLEQLDQSYQVYMQRVAFLEYNAQWGIPQ